MSAPTIHTIAQEAGVSIATVSRVLNRPHIVAEPTRQKVVQIIQARNFQVSKAAQLIGRGQRSARTGRIGYLVPNFPHRSTGFLNEETGRGIQKVLSQHALEMVIHYLDYRDPSFALPRILLENSVDGILMRPPHSRSLLIEICRNRKTVLLGNTFADLDLPCVLPDDWTGMRLILDYLWELGHRRIAFAGGPLNLLFNQRRLQGYRAFLEDREISCAHRLVAIHDSATSSDEEVVRFCNQHLDEWMQREPPPTAIATASDGFAVALIRAARERGLRVPEDLSVTGYGDQYYAAHTDPPLTTARVDFVAMGEIAATQLLHLIEGAAHSVQSLIRPALIERRSCAAIKTVISNQ